MQRIKLRDRALPDYSHGEECMNMVTHIVGGGIGVLVLLACVLKGAFASDVWAVVTGAVYGGTMIALYAVSSIYHGLRPNMGKKVMQVVDEDIKESLHPWDKAQLIMMYDLFNMLLDSVC